MTYTNREISWLDFNQRVLAIASDETQPLLERVKFLSIYANNLEEFFQVRVAGVEEQYLAGIDYISHDGATPEKQLATIRARVSHDEKKVEQCWADIKKELAEHNIVFKKWNELTKEEEKLAQKIFKKEIFPILTPLAVDPGRPFPFISNLSVNIGVWLENKEKIQHFARVKVPGSLNYIQTLTEETHVLLTDMIGANLEKLFTGMTIQAWCSFKITRNADLDLEAEEADDLLEAIETELQRRKYGQIIRVEIPNTANKKTRNMLIRELGVKKEHIEEVGRPINLTALAELYKIPARELKSDVHIGSEALNYKTMSSDQMFKEIDKNKTYVHHPYISFSATTEEFIKKAANDPQVLAIKMTLYRTSESSPIINALVKAAESNKQVSVLIELKARFDEQRNIEWARRLENAGVHVTYGLVGLKVHTKTILVLRKEKKQIRTYYHIGTGNYNNNTARIYEDLGIFGSDEAVGEDLMGLFNTLTGWRENTGYQKLLVAPKDMAADLITKIKNETNNENGEIFIKVNSLVDKKTIEALYEASQKGVKINLVIRGICCLQPGIKDLSENITVRSLIGKYLEHSRLYYFKHGNGKTPSYHIGSADLMPRNLYKRVEMLTPVEPEEIQKYLNFLMETYMKDNTLAWNLKGTTWTKETKRTKNTHKTLERLHSAD